jgi:hypothetical protein
MGPAFVRATLIYVGIAGSFRLDATNHGPFLFPALDPNGIESTLIVSPPIHTRRLCPPERSHAYYDVDQDLFFYWPC